MASRICLPAWSIVELVVIVSMPIMMLAIMVSMIGGAEMPIVVEDHRCLGKRPLGYESSYFTKMKIMSAGMVTQRSCAY
jgi:hypothetical protein